MMQPTQQSITELIDSINNLLTVNDRKLLAEIKNSNFGEYYNFYSSEKITAHFKQQIVYLVMNLPKYKTDYETWVYSADRVNRFINDFIDKFYSNYNSFLSSLGNKFELLQNLINEFNSAFLLTKPIQINEIIYLTDIQEYILNSI